MTADDLVRYTAQALVVCMLVSLPAVAASAVVGLLVAFVQAVMSLQDQSIAYAVKLLVVAAVLVLCADWCGAQVLHFSQALFSAALRP